MRYVASVETAEVEFQQLNIVRFWKTAAIMRELAMIYAQIYDEVCFGGPNADDGHEVGS